MIMPVTRETDKQKIARLENLIRRLIPVADTLGRYMITECKDPNAGELGHMLMELKEKLEGHLGL